MVVYFAPLLFLLWALIAQIRRNKQADIRALAVCTFVIILIAGLRWYSDIDYEPYVEMYEDNPSLGGFNQESISALYGEAGYLFLSAIFKTLGGGFFLLAFACALSSVFLKSTVLRRLSGQASLAMCLYLCLHFITIEFIQMRWAVATGLLSLGFCFQYLQKYRAAVLCFALAPAFHYFSFLFWIVALLVTLKGYKRFYLLFVASLLGALLLKIDYLSQFLVSDSDIYLLTRLTRYASDPVSRVGLFSYAKLVLYPAIYVLCVWYRPSYPWKTERLNLFLFKLSLVALSVTFLVSFVPIFHFRATVIADFFSVIWVLNAMDKALEGLAKSLSFAVLGALFGVWYLIDLFTEIHSGYLYDYHTWLTAPAFCVLLVSFMLWAFRGLWKASPAGEVAARS
jgi:EpsG family